MAEADSSEVEPNPTLAPGAKPGRLVRILKACGLYVLVIVILQIVLFAGLVVAAAVPNHDIVKNLNTAISQKIYGPTSMRDRMGGTSDSYTECVEVGEGLGAPDMGLIRRAAEMPRLNTCVPGPAGGAAQIQSLAQDPSKTPTGVSSYYMYWNGYVVLTRPVLAWWGLGALRIVSGALLVLSGVGALVALAKRTKAVVPLALVSPLLFASNLMSEPSTSFSQALSMSAIALGLLISVVWAGRGLRWAVGTATVGGALFCYIDLLTIPATPWALTGMATAMVVYLKRRDIRIAAGHGVVASVAWIAAFALTWLSRWIIAAFFLGWHGVWREVKHLVLFRTGGSYQGVDTSFGAASRGNWSYWWRTYPTSHAVVVLAAIGLVVALVIAVRRFGIQQLSLAGVLALPAVIVYVWYEALKNHSQIHEFFVYRDVPVSIGIVLAAAVFAAVVPPRDAEDSEVRVTAGVHHGDVLDQRQNKSSDAETVDAALDMNGGPRAVGEPHRDDLDGNG